MGSMWCDAASAVAVAVVWLCLLPCLCVCVDVCGCECVHVGMRQSSIVGTAEYILCHWPRGVLQRYGAMPINSKFRCLGGGGSDRIFTLFQCHCWDLFACALYYILLLCPLLFTATIYRLSGFPLFLSSVSTHFWKCHEYKFWKNSVKTRRAQCCHICVISAKYFQYHNNPTKIFNL